MIPRPVINKIIGATCALGLILITSGCRSTGREAERKTIRLAISDEPSRLHPGKAVDTTSWAILNMCHESLMRMNAQGQSECGLAEECNVSPDGLTYTFRIRPNARWSNGDPIFAGDFVYAWKQVLAPDFQDGDNAYQLYCIKNAERVKSGHLHPAKLGIRILEERTLQVELEKPMPHFPELVTLFTFFPIHRATANCHPQWAEDAGEHYVCSGPFKLVNWKHQYCLELEKNEHYWEAERVRPPKIHISIIKDANTCLSAFESGPVDLADTMFNMFEAGEIDLIGTSPFGELPPEVVETYRHSGELSIQAGAVSHWCILNLDNPLLQNRNIRKALALAIDRARIAKSALSGMYTPTTHMLPAKLRGNQRPLFDDGNLSKAREHFEIGLRETGLRREDFHSLILMTDLKSSHQKMVQSIQQQWREVLGIEVALQHFENRVYLHNLKIGAFDLARSQWFADFFDALNFLDCFRNKAYGYHASSWENDEFRDLLDLASVEPDLERRQQLLDRAEEILIDELPIIPLFEQNSILLRNPRLRGMRHPLLGPLDFREAHLESQGQ